ncbi:MAG: tRNA (guanosine(46)-N7)-methyltransferase TrmB [Erysipelotrichaceae bacterium]|nr:tRNA (guanosine(46)-N7)-methyltransferase TrmB [Erysipelotrichaceae bacterium]
MRMRNKPWVSAFLEQYSGSVLTDPLTLKGRWKAVLNCPILHVEIGSGKGDYWLLMAQNHPDEGWIGIEKEPNCAAIALKKAQNLALANIRFILDDAAGIDQWFSPQEVDVIHLNFSDPWPKKRNTKRRLTHTNFLKQYAVLLSADGKIIMKTDNQQLFEFSLLSLQPDWLLEDISVDFRKIERPDAITEYERKFMQENKPIYRAVWRKRIV